MKQFFRENLIILLICVIIIALSITFIADWSQRLLVIITVGLFFVAVQEAVATRHAADAAEISAEAAKENQNQATYIHLASLWYDIKQRGLESDEFINPVFTSLFRQEEILEKYRRYHLYAWLCWGHAEDCYLKGFQHDEGFLPSIQSYKELHYAWLMTQKNRQMFGNNFLNWIDTELLMPAVEVKAEDTPEGQGVFATQHFTRGDFIGFFDGKPVKNRTKMSLQFGPDFHIEPASNTPFRRLNHSCDANAYFCGRNLYAWKAIHPGEEITIDYNCTEFELASSFECNCGSTACIGNIRGYSFLNEEQKNIRKGKKIPWLEEGEPSSHFAPLD